jgi:hypothetical protein
MIMLPESNIITLAIKVLESSLVRARVRVFVLDKFMRIPHCNVD